MKPISLAIIFLFFLSCSNHSESSKGDSTAATDTAKHANSLKDSAPSAASANSGTNDLAAKPAPTTKNAKVGLLKISKNYNISFTITNFGADVHGTLGGLQGEIKFDENDLANNIFNTSVDVKTINTGNKKRDIDLQEEKYFNSGKFPQISFKSTKIIKAPTGYRATGSLTIKGITKTIDMPFAYTKVGNAGSFASNFNINRHDFNIGGNGPIMGDIIKVKMTVPVEM